MFKSFTKMSLSAQIFTGLAAGILFGFILSLSAQISPGVDNVISNYVVTGFDIIKRLFINALKMVVVPLVLVSLICGTCSLSDPKKLGSLGVDLFRPR